MPSPAELLADVPFFSLLDDQERAVLAERVDTVKFGAGKTIFSVGDPGESLYVVRSGKVELFFRNDTGERILLETAITGDFFGELSLLDGGARTATALVVEDLEALQVDRGDLEAFLRIRPEAALDFVAAIARRLRQTSALLRHTASRNVNEEQEDHRTRVMKIADWISDFSGSLPFLFIHLGIFFVWIILNVGSLGQSRFGGFDRFPFGLLTMVVSLEAIILSVFVLLSQNRQVARERVRNDIEYEVNLKAELEVAELHQKVDILREDLLSRMDAMEGKRANAISAAIQ